MRGGLLITALVLVVAVPAADASAPGTGTLRGDVILTPTCPGPQRPGQDCTSPFRGTILVRRASDGKLVARAHSNERGRFVRRLPSGSYVLVPRRCGMSARDAAGSSLKVRIRAGETTRIHVVCDTGLR